MQEREIWEYFEKTLLPSPTSATFPTYEHVRETPDCSGRRPARSYIPPKKCQKRMKSSLSSFRREKAKVTYNKGTGKGKLSTNITITLNVQLVLETCIYEIYYLQEQPDMTYDCLVCLQASARP
ncbi:hypothetical protein PR048_013876 [Dryococelus australis]|uniref:Uncharacterized protein n=1 Tax=Dryococelus australis TaxID=614101 RepID=A0ABQ9HTF0_9NEOP|nr:hypothetical protein PR048_013876 [Dryococelus australis]